MNQGWYTEIKIIEIIGLKSQGQERFCDSTG